MEKLKLFSRVGETQNVASKFIIKKPGSKTGIALLVNNGNDQVSIEIPDFFVWKNVIVGEQ
jgi:hypothetical protein